MESLFEEGRKIGSWACITVAASPLPLLPITTAHQQQKQVLNIYIIFFLLKILNLVDHHRVCSHNAKTLKHGKPIVTCSFLHGHQVQWEERPLCILSPSHWPAVPLLFSLSLSLSTFPRFPRDSNILYCWINLPQNMPGVALASASVGVAASMLVLPLHTCKNLLSACSSPSVSALSQSTVFFLSSLVESYLLPSNKQQRVYTRGIKAPTISMQQRIAVSVATPPQKKKKCSDF